MNDSDQAKAAIMVERQLLAEAIGNELAGLSADIDAARLRAAAAEAEADEFEARQLGILDLVDRLEQIDTDEVLATAAMLEDARRDAGVQL